MSSSPGPRRAAIVFIFVTVALDALATGIVAPVLPGLIEEFTGSNASAGAMMGVLVALWAGTPLVTSPVIGSLSDRFGRRPVILASTLGAASDCVLAALAPNLWWLALGRLIAGSTSSANFTTPFAYVADVTPPEQRSRAYGLLGAAASGGFIAGPFLGGLLGEISPRAPFWFAAMLSGIAFLYGLFVLPESWPAERRVAFRWSQANPFGALRLLRSSTELFGLSAVTFLVYFAYHGFSTVFVLYTAYRYHWDVWELGLLQGLVGALDMLVQGVLVNQFTKRWGDRTTMICGLFGGACGLVWMGLAPNSSLFVLAIVILPNALLGLAIPTLQSLMTQRVSESEQGQLQGANTCMSGVAGVLSPLFFGMVYSLSLGDGTRSPAYSGAAFVIAGMVLCAAGVIGRRVVRQGRVGTIDIEASVPLTDSHG